MHLRHTCMYIFSIYTVFGQQHFGKTTLPLGKVEILTSEENWVKERPNKKNNLNIPCHHFTTSNVSMLSHILVNNFN